MLPRATISWSLLGLLLLFLAFEVNDAAEVLRGQCSCGRKNVQIGSRIFNGKDAGVNEYPMMAAIIDTRIVNEYNAQVWCGATIISNKHVITAAHCLYDPSVKDIVVLVGDFDLTTGMDTKAAKVYKVDRFDRHHNHVRGGKPFDIAVVTVQGTIAFSDKVSPVCLPFNHVNDNFEGALVDILGWGAKEPSGVPSTVLQKISIPVINQNTCMKRFAKYNINQSQFCTYGAGKDACEFDSGGPVLWQNPATGRVVLIGIISFGDNCSEKSAGVQTRVSSYLDWILQVTPGVRLCGVE